MRVDAWLALLADFILKLRYEEQLLGTRFPDYAAYRQTSKRLIPWVW